MKKTTILILSLFVAIAFYATGYAENFDPTAEVKIGPIVLNPGGYQSGTSVLDGLISAGYYDNIQIAAVGSGTLGIDVTDCCVMGDTMAAIAIVIKPGSKPQTIVKTATSPNYIHFDIPVSTFAIAIVITGYTNCPGGFPAGYSWAAYF